MAYFLLPVSQFHACLLVALMVVDIRVAAHFQAQCHRLLAHHEIRLQYLLHIVVFVINRQAVVAAQGQPALLVGNVQTVMGIEHGGTP